jgi:hypothetical protein
MTRVAILGWGSLLWDSRPEFDDYHGDWIAEGPLLPLEFSRVSKSRRGALTLVVDPVHGTDCLTAYAEAVEDDVSLVVQRLAQREGCSEAKIGVAGRPMSCRTRGQGAAVNRIQSWIEASQFDCVVWTDLASNFTTVTGVAFSAGSAISYLQSLDSDVVPAAMEYIQRAPRFVVTPFRSALGSTLSGGN